MTFEEIYFNVWSIDYDNEDDGPNDIAQQRFNELIMKAKRLIGEGRIEEALKLNKKALEICYSEKLAKKIRKMEVQISLKIFGGLNQGF